MNKFIGMGRLTGEPTIIMSNSGSSIAKFTTALDRAFKQEGQPTADFVNCVAFGKTAEFIEKYFHKGNRIAYTGHLQTGSYEKDGVKHYTTDIVIETVEFCESKQSNAQEAKDSNVNNDFLNVPEEIDSELPFD